MPDVWHTERLFITDDHGNQSKAGSERTRPDSAASGGLTAGPSLAVAFGGRDQGAKPAEPLMDKYR
jgi:hypothetical protein